MEQDRKDKLFGKKQLTEYQRGILAAAEVVEEYDKLVKHDYRLSDCVLCKLGLIGKRNVRRTPVQQLTLFKD